MSIKEQIEIEQIKLAEKRLETLGLHKSPVKIKGRKGIKSNVSNGKKRHYSRNVTIKNNPKSKEFQDYFKKLQEKARAKDKY